MTTAEARSFFDARLAAGKLYGGSNFMIDAEDTVWDCTIWVNGGIADLERNPREDTPHYHRIRSFAARHYSTTFENR